MSIKYTIKASGYLKDELLALKENNLLLSLPDITEGIFSDDIYSKDRIGKKTVPKDLGTVENSHEWNVQFYWWNSESISNYYDGIMRIGFLINDQETILLVKGFVNHILNSQDEDGYIGIYDKDMRYRFNSENGELWSKATLYRVLLGYYKYTYDETVYNAVVRAVDNVMINFPINNSTPFKGIDSFAGVAHGLMFTDVCYQMYVLTKDKQYIDYAIFLYEDYQRHKVSETDILIKNLEDPNYLFKGHGVHTYEHLRSLAIYAKEKDKTDLYEKYLSKLQKATSPSGGPIGDEWVAENTADARMNGYEFCSVHELLDSYIFVSKLGLDNKYKEAVHLFKNAHFGMKHNDTKMISYLKSDDSFSMTGDFQYHQDYSVHKVQTRYKYSPTHQDAAVCCVPNSFRIIPYFIENALTIKDTVTINYICPLEVTLEISGKNYYLNIIQNTPFGDYQIETNLGDLLVIDTPLNTNELIINRDHYNRVHFKFNDIVFAYPIDSIKSIGKEYNNQLTDIYLKPKKEYISWKVDSSSAKLDKKSLKLSIKAYRDNEQKIIVLIPMYYTDLRQVTFNEQI